MKYTGDDGSTANGHSPPLERSRTQRLAALERANQIRTQRAKLKKDLKADRVSIHALLREPPEFILTAKVFDVLLAVPKFGRVKVNKVLTHCRISPSKKIGGLSQRQRDELLRLLDRDSHEQQQPARQAAHMGASSVPAAAAGMQPETAFADDELVLGVERLLESARQIGSCAGRAARDAGAELDASAPRPDTTALQAALTRTLRESRLVLAPVIPPGSIESGDSPHTTAPVAAPIASPGEGQLDAPRRVDEVRLARAELKRKIGLGTLPVAAVILTCPWEAASMTIAELLTSQPRWGTTRASEFLAGIGMPETKTVGSMTERQRGLLASML